MTPGLEPLLAGEFATLLPGVRSSAREGGLELRVTQQQLWILATGSRLAESLRVRIGRFQARTFDELKAGLGRLAWAAYLPRDAVPPWRITCRKSRLFHSDAVEERARAVLAARAGKGSRDVEHPVAYLRIHHDKATVSIDASGALLHRRGWRTEAGSAPLRETLAAACLSAADIPAQQPIWDPFCGSGTFLIEAERARLGGPVHLERSFSFELWPTHDAAGWSRYEPQPSHPSSGVVHLGSDVDPGVVDMARRNAERAGIEAATQWRVGDFEATVADVPEGAAIVTNPPYGKRLPGGRRLDRLFERLGGVLAARPDLHPTVVLTANRDLASHTGLPWEELARFSNRGVRVRLMRLVRRAGSP